jgi:hypothetical protein
MPTEEIFAIGRVVERLIICLWAGASLTYGWNLFRVGVVDQQSAELSVKDWRANLKRVGPGVFFALFGAAILVFSLHSSLKMEPTFGPPSARRNAEEPGTNGSTKSSTEPSDDAARTRTADDSSKNANPRGSLDSGSMSYSYLGGSDRSNEKRLVASINTLQQIATPDRFSMSAEKKAVAKSLAELAALRDAILIHKFGAPLFRDYKMYREQVATNVEVGQDEKKRFSEIDSWARANRILN